MDVEENEDRLADFRINLQGFRKAAGLTQAELAEQMRERGYGFQQQTVQKIENGTRTVRLDEGAAMAEVLKAGLDDLLMPPEQMYGLTLSDRMADATFALREAVKEYLRVQSECARYIDLVDDQHLQMDDVIETPYEVVDYAIAKYSYDADETMRQIENLAAALPGQPKYAEVAEMLRSNIEKREVGPVSAEVMRRLREAQRGVDPETP